MVLGGHKVKSGPGGLGHLDSIVRSSQTQQAQDDEPVLILNYDHTERPCFEIRDASPISQVSRESDREFPFPVDDEDFLDEELEAPIEADVTLEPAYGPGMWSDMSLDYCLSES